MRGTRGQTLESPMGNVASVWGRNRGGGRGKGGSRPLKKETEGARISPPPHFGPLVEMRFFTKYKTG